MTSQPPPNAPSHHRPHPDDDDVDLRAYFYTLVEARWLIASVTAACLLIAVSYALIATPVYRTDTLVQVEEKSGGMAGLDEVSALFTGETPAETEIEILRSRSLVGTVVEQLALDIEVTPNRFPVIGGAIARRWNGKGTRPPVLGMSSYAWGGEKLKVDRLSVPAELENQNLVLVVGKEGAFEVLREDGTIEVRGRAGEAATSSDGTIQLFVKELVANEGTRFEVAKRNRDETVAKVQEQLNVREKGKKTGILQVTLEGPDPRKIAATLDGLATAYLKQNVDRKSEEAEKTLEFLNGQLPLLRSNLDQAEQELNEYRSKKGTVDLSREAEALLERAVEVEKGMTQLEIERADLKQRFTDSHPKLVAMREQVGQLKSEREAIEAKLKQLPEAELKSARYMRDVKVANELYVLLLNKAQELKVVKSGTIGNVRIVDPAIIANKPVSPRKAMTGAMGLLLGLAAGASLALVRKALNGGVEDPNEIEKALGLAVYATVPHSEFQGEQMKQFDRKRTRTLPILAAAQQTDAAVESVRSLRTALQFALMDAKRPVVAIGGPSPNIGKSFISVNLAQVIADSGKRVLLIDADMRKGKLHTYFTGVSAPGLSEVISGSREFDAVVQRDAKTPNLSFLPAGVVPPNPSELLMSDRFRALVERVSKEFELVIIDCAPILAVTDGAIVGQLAGVNLLVLKAAHHPMGEIETATKRYTQNGVTVKGVVFNDTNARTGYYGYAGYTYQYRY